MPMDAKLFEERTIFKVGTPARGKRVGFRPDFHMPLDADFGWVDQPQPDGASIRHPFSGIGCKHASAVNGMPVSLEHPLAALAVMPVFSSATKPTPLA
jgi:hypothetical protein